MVIFITAWEERGERPAESSEKEVSAGKMAKFFSEKMRLDRIHKKHPPASNRSCKTCYLESIFYSKNSSHFPGTKHPLGTTFMSVKKQVLLGWTLKWGNKKAG